MGTIAQLAPECTWQLDHDVAPIGLLEALLECLAAEVPCDDAELRAAVAAAVASLPTGHRFAGIRLEGVGRPMLVRLAAALVA